MRIGPSFITRVRRRQPIVFITWVGHKGVAITPAGEVEIASISGLRVLGLPASKPTPEQVGAITRLLFNCWAWLYEWDQLPQGVEP